MHKLLLHSVIFLFIVCFSMQIKAQTEFGYFQGNEKRMFVEAESYLLYGDFSEALYLFQLLKNRRENNHNLDYKIGLCLLNIPGKKDKAIHPLEIASKYISLTSKDGSLDELKSPPDAMYFLANAYRINNQLELAVECYKKFKELVIDTTKYDMKMIDDHIKSCDIAKDLISKPKTILYKNLGSPINTASSNLNAIKSGNDSVLVFITKLKFYDAVFYTKLNDKGKWSEPINIIPQLEVDGNCYPTYITYDAKEMYFYRDEDYGGDIFVSRFLNGKWSTLEKLNKNINTKYWESHASLSPDGNTIYFTSNREGGFGNLDIYKSIKDLSTKEWGPAINLGSTINSRFDEQTPFLSSDGKKLFFSSCGHYNMGGFDVFVSESLGLDSWSKPQNLGYPINTTDDDVFFVPIGDGKKAIYTLIRNEDGIGREDIYLIEIE